MLFWSAETMQTSSLAKALDSESTKKTCVTNTCSPEGSSVCAGRNLGCELVQDSAWKLEIPCILGKPYINWHGINAQSDWS